MVSSRLARIFPLIWGLFLFASAQAGDVTVELKVGKTEGGVDLRIAHQGEAAVSRLEFSDDLSHWNVLAASREPSWHQEVLRQPEGKRYFRAVAAQSPEVAPGDAWKSEIIGFKSIGRFSGGFLKFTVLLDDPTRIYFQDGESYPFHYQFAREHLPPFLGIGFREFNAATLHPGPGQQAITGAIVSQGGLGVQILGQGGYPPETFRFLFDLIETHLDFDPEWFPDGPPDLHLIPTQTQLEPIYEVEAELQALGIELSPGVNRSSNQVSYVEGWALGRLRYVPSASIEEAFLSGELKSSDILLTDSLPAELPFVEGILTMTPATPNSHVLILAQSNEVPAGYVRGVSRQEALMRLDGQQVILDVKDRINRVAVYPESSVSEAVLTSLRALKERARPNVTPIVVDGPLSFPMEVESEPGIERIGGKATHFHRMGRIIPEYTPSPALAFGFSLWDRFLAQPSGLNGQSLGDRITDRLAPFERNADIGALHEALIEVRSWIVDGSFDQATRNEVIEALSGFEPGMRIRFRSSTNLEDTEGFVGAGLYDSFSGCLADDLDEDDDGPSGCDPEREKERGVFRALGKVFASFYNLNAYLQRRRFDVEESEVGMAVLVHHSFPDEIEAANGVATGGWQYEPRWGWGTSFTLVSQVGAVSITNPVGGERPEIYETVVGGSNLRQTSSLLRTGQEKVMDWTDYTTLIVAFYNCVNATLMENEVGRRLEFEYKKLTDGRLIIKQMRVLPNPARQYERAALIGPGDFILLQNQHVDAFAAHRMKAHWRFSPQTMWWEKDTVLRTSLERFEGGEAGHQTSRRFEDIVSTLPGVLQLDWQDEKVSMKSSWWIPQEWNLSQNAPGPPAFAPTPILSLTELAMDPQSFPGISLTAGYPEPVFGYVDSFHGPDGSPPQMVDSQSVNIRPGHPDDDPSPDSYLASRAIKITNDWSVETEFYWFSIDSIYTEMTAAATFALDRFKETKITGMTTEPISLTDYFSQSYQGFHHNLGDGYIFEPGLSPTLTEEQRTELAEKDIRAIYLDQWHLMAAVDHYSGPANSFFIQRLSGEWEVVHFSTNQ